MHLRLACVLLLSTACGSPEAPADAARSDAGEADTGALDAEAPDAGDARADVGPVDAGPLVEGFQIGGPAMLGTPPSGTTYTLDLATGTGTAGSFGAPCTTGNDCTALGPHAACLGDGTTGFCTIDCDTDPEGPSVLCPTGALCYAGIRPDAGRVCLPSCIDQRDCALGFHCSGALTTFNSPTGHARACLPLCHTDADCNADTSGLRCDATRQVCTRPREVLGAGCSIDQDCAGLDPSARCMHSTRDETRSYCTVACDPTSATACTLGEDLGPCVAGYATTTDGAPVPVCLGGCHSNAQCQAGSDATCSYLPSIASGVCTIACTSDADCIHGTCNVSRGECQAAGFWSSDCASDSNCPGGLCVRDFHRPTQWNCSARCTVDGDCPSGAVCVMTPVADDGAGERLPYMTSGVPDVGFCAPSCTPDAGVCTDPTTTCLMPAATPEIDFAGSGAASHAFCWR